MKPLEFSVLGPLMGGYGSQAFLGCVHVENGGGIKPIVMVFLPEEIVDDPELLRRVFAETEIAARIDHVNVIGVVGIARLEEGFARVVEFGDAESLRSVYRRAQTMKKQIPLKIATGIIADACMGAHYAHELGEMETGVPLIHGGLRPETLLVSFQGMAKVTGYGVSTLVEALNRARGQDANAGRDAYTAPEQTYGGRAAATVQTDVYSLGTVLYEALTGKQPYGQDTDLAEAMIRDELHRPDSGVSEAMARIIVKATQKRSRERYANPFEMRADLLEHCETATELEVRAFMDELFPRDMVPRSTRDQLLTTARAQPPRPTGRILAEGPSAPDPMVTDPRMRAERMLAAQPTLSTAPSIDSGRAESPPSSFNAPQTTPPTPSMPPIGAASSGDTRPLPSHRAPATIPPLSAQSAMPQAAMQAQNGSVPPVLQPRPPQQGSWGSQSSSPPSMQGGNGFNSQPPQPYTYAPPPQAAKQPVWLYVALGLAGGMVIALGTVVFVKGGAPPAPVVVEAPPKVEAPPQMPLEPIAPVAAPTPTPTPVAARPPVEEPAPPPKKATGPGKLAVTSDPPMTITVDGKPFGSGNAEGEVAPGKHTVKGKDEKTGGTATRVVTVGSGKTVHVDLEIGKGALNIDAPPGSKVFVDGKLMGTTPMGPIEVLEGTRKVLVKQGTLEYRHNVPVKRGIEATLTVSFHSN